MRLATKCAKHGEKTLSHAKKGTKWRGRSAGIIQPLSGSATALGIGRIFSRPLRSAFFRRSFLLTA